MLVVNTVENFFEAADNNAFVLDHQHGRHDVTIANQQQLASNSCKSLFRLCCVDYVNCNTNVIGFPQSNVKRVACLSGNGKEYA